MFVAAGEYKNIVNFWVIRLTINHFSFSSYLQKCIQCRAALDIREKKDKEMKRSVKNAGKKMIHHLPGYLLPLHT